MVLDLALVLDMVLDLALVLDMVLDLALVFRVLAAGGVEGPECTDVEPVLRSPGGTTGADGEPGRTVLAAG
uniref:Secreted protein n=1 Tax=Knipowitschia caucasica TaxID=637954 RepID=A0AAV2KZX2_KNICA